MKTYLLTGFIALAIPAACLSGCTTDYETMGTVMTPGMNLEPETEEPTGSIERNKSFIYACNFDDTDVTVKSVNCQLEVTDDPVRPGKCGKVTMNKCGTSDCVQIILDHPLDFTLNDAIITFELYGQKKDADIVCKLSSSFGKQFDLSPDRFLRKTQKTGEWEKFEFDWSAQKPQSNLYNTITIVINYGKENKTMGEVWYVDNISVPNSDLSSISLFKRITNHSAPKPSGLRGDATRGWKCNSTANPQILTPEESDGKHWWLYMRGADGTYGEIGAYTQEKEKFNPIGSWTECKGGVPVIKRGFRKEYDDYDAFTAIDPAFVKNTDNNVMYMFYKGLSNVTDEKTGKKVPSILMAKTQDGVTFQPVEKVFKQNAGVSDALYHDGKYYLFVSRRRYVTADPEKDEEPEENTDIISLGGVVDQNKVALNFDRYSINGQKVTRIGDYWFMFYQCSPCHDDFPDRIHAAYSKDLKNWTKIQNPQPLFTRGKRHSWDEGAIWAPEVFEYGDDLYMYYEGWGRGTDDRAQGDTIPNRDKKYFKGGHSEIGVAKCSKKKFLEWCGKLE